MGAKREYEQHRDSLVVTDPATNPALTGLTEGRADGIPVLSVGMVVRGGSP